MYSWICGLSIGPKFLGYFVLEGRTIGFSMEFVESRHAFVAVCRALVGKLLGLGILHGEFFLSLKNVEFRGISQW